MKRTGPLLLLLLILFLWSCTKTEVVDVTGNQPPADNSVSDLTISNYINRLYINLLGRKADTTEFNAAFTLVRANSNSKTVREQLIDQIAQQPEWYFNITDRARKVYIEGVDSTMMKRDLLLILSLLNDPDYAPVYPALEEQKNDLIELMELDKDFNSGILDVVGVHKVCINNTYYDQINMGTENFVVSMFQHFLDRYPSSSELQKGKLMVDGVNSSLFLETGHSKDDFIKIFFRSEDYYEGQVFRLFREYLFRDPTQEESVSLATEYASTHDYRNLQKFILSSDEFYKK